MAYNQAFCRTALEGGLVQKATEDQYIEPSLALVPLPAIKPSPAIEFLADRVALSYGPVAPARSTPPPPNDGSIHGGVLSPYTSPYAQGTAVLMLDLALLADW